MQVAGCSALVTGAASGLGAATARRLAAAGATVTAVDRDAGRAGTQSRPGTTFVVADVTDEEQVQHAVDEAGRRGPLRIVVNCAGISLPGQRTVGRSGAVHDLAGFRRVVEVNLIGTFNVTRLAAAAMPPPADPADERGVVVNTSSVAAEDGQVGQVGYAASKAAVAGMTLPLARDLAPLGIRVNTILPGAFDTAIFGPRGEAVTAFQSRLLADAAYPLRLGDPDEFAALVEHLVTNAYVNATCIRLDAGTRMRAKP